MQANQPDADPPVVDEAAAVQEILNNRHLFGRLQTLNDDELRLLLNMRLFEFLRGSNGAANEAPTEAPTETPTEAPTEALTVRMTPREAVIAALRRFAMHPRSTVVLDDFITATDLIFPERNFPGMRSDELKPMTLVVREMAMCSSDFERAILFAAMQPTTAEPSTGLIISIMKGADIFFADEAPSLFSLFVANEAFAASGETLGCFRDTFQVNVESFQGFLFENDGSVESFVEENPLVDLSVLVSASRATYRRSFDDYNEEIGRLCQEFPPKHVLVAVATHALCPTLFHSERGALKTHKIRKSVEETFVFLFKAMEAAQATRLSMLVRNIMVGSVQDNEAWLAEARRLTDPTWGNHRKAYTPEQILGSRVFFGLLEPYKDATFLDQDGQERYYFSARVRNIMDEGFQTDSETTIKGLRVKQDVRYLDVDFRGPHCDLGAVLEGTLEPVIERITRISWKDVELGHILPLWAHSQVAHHPAVVDLKGAYVKDKTSGDEDEGEDEDTTSGEEDEDTSSGEDEDENTSSGVSIAQYLCSFCSRVCLHDPGDDEDEDTTSGEDEDEDTTSGEDEDEHFVVAKIYGTCRNSDKPFESLDRLEDRVTQHVCDFLLGAAQAIAVISNVSRTLFYDENVAFGAMDESKFIFNGFGKHVLADFTVYRIDESRSLHGVSNGRFDRQNEMRDIGATVYASECMGRLLVLHEEGDEAAGALVNLIHQMRQMEIMADACVKELRTIKEMISE